MKKYLFTLLLGLNLFATAWATDVANLYQAEVPVASTSPADYQKALPQALAQVFVKASMNSKVTQIDSIRKTLNTGVKLVQSYNYVSPEVSNGRGLILQVRFSPKALNQLLQNAGQPAVSRQRPLTLVWIVTQSPTTKTLNDDKTSLQNAADKLALPLLWPAGDAQDQAAVEPLWSLDADKIQAAAQRYPAENILVGKISKQGNTWQGQWLWIKPSGNQSLQTQGTTANQAIAAVAPQLGQALAAANPASSANTQPDATPAKSAPPPITTSVATPPSANPSTSKTSVPVIDESLVVVPAGSTNGVAQSFPTDSAPTPFVPDDATTVPTPAQFVPNTSATSP